MTEFDPYKLFKRGAAAAIPLLAVVACSRTTDQTPVPTTAPKPPAATSTTSTTPNSSPASPDSQNGTVRFQQRPDTNLSVGDCNKVSDTWAVNIDNKPQDTEDLPTTVGMVSGYEEGGRQPVVLSGVTYRGIGDYKYEVSTSDSPDTSQVIDLQPGSEGYSEILGAEIGKYATVFTARNGEDGNTYFRINCLPNFEFDGSNDKTFRPEIPPLTPPGDSNNTTPTLPEGTQI